ncbi:MAG: hypothetical protein JNK29_02645, partial [Anaerolineales bacterium]|nr:hypothetical protein [Anaerolineales bacterium]
MIYTLSQLPAERQAAAGGKGRTLARLLQARYPVPPGFVLLPEAFAGDQLTPAAWEQASAYLAALRQAAAGPAAFAVRSSALGEDSAAASFAGEFETVLDVSTNVEVRRAISAVRGSRHAARVQAYRQAQGIAGGQEMAVVVQRLVRADLAGVLFTADPVTGSRAAMVGNYVHGLGEALVAGERNPATFTLAQPAGRYAGPAELKRWAPALFRLAARLEADLGGPQDIEWAVAGGRLYLLQARPITTLRAHNPATGEWNDSLSGDYLWTNANFGEAVPDVMTPLTWSLLQVYFEETIPFQFPGQIPAMGNLGGRFYMNLSALASVGAALGLSRARLNHESEEFFGRLPEHVTVPLMPLPRWRTLAYLIPVGVRAKSRVRRNQARLAAFTAAVPARVADLRARLAAAATPPALAELWTGALAPLLRQACQMLQAGTSRYENAARSLRHDLRRLVGEEDANTLMTGLSADGAQLASLGPLLGLAQVARGELSRAAFAETYGHRGPHEFEVSLPRPAEDPAWIDQQLAGLDPASVDGRLQRQAEARAAVWARFTARQPRLARAMGHRLAAAAAAARGREAIRSEVIRIFGLLRAFALRAGDLTGLGEAVFFLAHAELSALLRGDRSSLAFIPARRATHARYSALPPYPALISGRFDPVRWAADPARRSDFYDAHQTPAPASAAPEAAGVRGFPGAAGVVEGSVRVLLAMEDGAALQPGEILVTVSTNVGWTPLFPRAAAVVTDVGAPLSHAAIVARELGLP